LALGYDSEFGYDRSPSPENHSCNKVGFAAVWWGTDLDKLTTFPVLAIPIRVTRHVLLLLLLLLLLAPLEELFKELKLSERDTQEEESCSENKPHFEDRQYYGVGRL
jgi:hypothetical protein